MGKQINSRDEATLELKAQLAEARSVIKELRLAIAEGRKFENELKEELPNHIARLSRDAVEKVVGSAINPELERLRKDIDISIETKRKQITAYFDHLMDVLSGKVLPDQPTVDEIVRVTEWVRRRGPSV